MEKTEGNMSVEVVASAPAPVSLPQASAIRTPPPTAAEGASYQATAPPALSKPGNSTTGKFVGNPTEAAVVAAAAAPGVGFSPVSSRVLPGMIIKKKRGRPRRYSPDGGVTIPLNPMPISASMPPPGEFTLTSPDGTVMKRGKVKPMGSTNKHTTRCPDIKHSGEAVPCSSANFTPHVINVAAGEDVTMKVISFSQQGPHAICILSGTGVISDVTLRQPDSSGGTLTYEGRFELLSLSGSFMPNESGGTKSRTGGMSVSLAGSDGRVIGGGVAGLLVAAGPVQVVVGSFLPFHTELQPRKHRPESISLGPVAIPPVCSMSMHQPHNIGMGQHSSGSTGKPTISVTSSILHGESWSSMQSASEASGNPTNINISLHGG